MPFLGAQRWLLPRAPTLLALLLVLLMSATLAWQCVALQRLLHSTPATGSAAPANPGQNTDVQTLLPLFGSGQPVSSGIAPSTGLSLTLLGSFVQADSPRSSAIIQLEGSPAKRYSVGQELSSGVSLHAVYRDRVELKRNGRLETLAFSKRPTLQSTAAASPAQDSDNLAQLQALSEEDTQQLQQRMQELRERIQGADAATATAPSGSAITESPEPSTEAY